MGPMSPIDNGDLPKIEPNLLLVLPCPLESTTQPRHLALDPQPQPLSLDPQSRPQQDNHSALALGLGKTATRPQPLDLDPRSSASAGQPRQDSYSALGPRPSASVRQSLGLSHSASALDLSHSASALGLGKIATRPQPLGLSPQPSVSTGQPQQDSHSTSARQPRQGNHSARFQAVPQHHIMGPMCLTPPLTTIRTEQQKCGMGDASGKRHNGRPCPAAVCNSCPSQAAPINQLWPSTLTGYGLQL